MQYRYRIKIVKRPKSISPRKPPILHEQTHILSDGTEMTVTTVKTSSPIKPAKEGFSFCMVVKSYRLFGPYVLQIQKVNK